MTRVKVKRTERLRVGYSPLHDGTIKINAYKHGFTVIVATSIAMNRLVVITNAPLVGDTWVLKQIIEESGGQVTIKGHVFSMDPRNMKNLYIDPRLSKLIHSSLYLAPAFAVRFGEAMLGGVGGCQIGETSKSGSRAFMHVVEVMKRFGIASTVEGESIHAVKATHVTSVEIDIMDFSTDPTYPMGECMSGATETALLCAISTQQTTIHHPHQKTGVSELIEFMRVAGYQIQETSTSIMIQAPPQKQSGEVTFKLSDCVSEIMTYISLAICADIRLTLAITDAHRVKAGLKDELELLESMGVQVFFKENALCVERPVAAIVSQDILATPRTITSDHQPFFVLMLLLGNRRAKVTDEVFEERFGYVDALKEMGAVLVRDDKSLFVYPSQMRAGNYTFYASDVRAGAAVLLAAVITPGETIIGDIHHLHRGYESLIPSLRSLGATIEVLAAQDDMSILNP